jgi:hypothetical protein
MSHHDIKADLAHDEAAYPVANKAGSDIYVDTYVEGTPEEARLLRKIDFHVSLSL